MLERIARGFLSSGAPSTPTGLAVLFAAAFVVALVLTAFLAYWMRGRAERWGLSEVPRHDGAAEPVARVGGLAIVAGVTLAGALTLLASGLAAPDADETVYLGPVFLGTFAMALLGLLDDRVELRARTKFLFQALAATAVWIAGVQVGGFQTPGGYVALSPLLSYGLTLLWFVAITNAFNLVDGADGVAGGAAIIATAAMFVVALLLDEPLIALVLVLTAGAVLAFLFFNFPPASIYLGDAGSLSLGFLLAGLGLVASSKATTTLAIAIPVVSLGLPLLDTGLAVVRRLLRGEGFYRRDLGHIHHRLQKLGHSPRQVALLLWAACAALSMASLILLSPDTAAVGLVFLVLGTATFIGMQRLKIPELLELRRLITRGMQQPGVIARSVAIREAVGAVQEAGGPRELAEALGVALGGAGVTSAEVRLNHGLAQAWEDRDLGGFVREGDELVWRWEEPSEGDIGPADSAAGAYWEAHLPLEGGPGEVELGTLRLRRHLQGGVPAELEIFTQTLLPEVARTIAGIEAQGPELPMVARPALVEPKPGSDRFTA